MASKVRGWLSPVVHLSNNWISRIGVALVTTATVLFMFLLPSTLHPDVHPYLGIASFLILPGIFFAGLALIPLGIWLRRRREMRAGTYPASFAKVTARTGELRKLLVFIGVMTVVNVVLGGLLTYRAVHYMESVNFCGQACHSVMAPEYAAYVNSPHARVACVACHIGPGASWFVQSKLSGSWQVISVNLNLYPRPIPTPIENLRPARETCEACHWPQKFGSDRLRIINKYADDEANSLTKTVLLMRIGGGRQGRTIHDAHLGPGVEISYWHTDHKRQQIPRVEYRNAQTGRTTLYKTEEDKGGGERRVMDCVDCHNRPTHTFEMPEAAIDREMATGAIPNLPFIKKTAVELLKKEYPSQEIATRSIVQGVEAFYKQSYADVANGKAKAVSAAGQRIAAIYNRNIFPQMRVKWGTYPNNLGHNDFPGCFRCHDEMHAAADGKTISQDCNTCHQLLAQDEPSPKILEDLGLAPAPPQK
jgi:hypothetical protein